MICKYPRRSAGLGEAAPLRGRIVPDKDTKKTGRYTIPCPSALPEADPEPKNGRHTVAEGRFFHRPISRFVFFSYICVTRFRHDKPPTNQPER